MMSYSLFSLAFSYPTQDVVCAISEMSKQESLSTFGSVRDLGTLQLEELQAEYTTLFVNTCPTLPCPPYESFYREGVVYGNTVNEVLAIYRQKGLAYVCQQGEPPDHISVELDFLSQTGDHDFLARMRQWVPRFTASVKNSTSVYEAVARDLENLLR